MPEVVRVLESFKRPGPQTNPYIIQLRDSLASTPGLDVSDFSWKTAVLGGYDVFHTHWPEALLERRGFVSTWGRRVLYAVFLARMAVLGIPVVRTVHNTDLPQGIGRLERALLKRTERLTRMRIVLNPFTPIAADARSVLIEHGHYRDWFAKYPSVTSESGRVLFFGKVRRYKNVDGLVRAFAACSPESGATRLRIVGSPSSPELAEAIRVAASADSRIELDFGYVEDDRLVHEVGRASLVVLPYPEMHNSGSVLAALSLKRPVLVPDNAFNRLLAEEVGEKWVVRYSGELTAAAIEGALVEVADLDVESGPDLTKRDWADTGSRHADAFRQALA